MARTLSNRDTAGCIFYNHWVIELVYNDTRRTSYPMEYLFAVGARHIKGHASSVFVDGVLRKGIRNTLDRTAGTIESYAGSYDGPICIEQRSLEN